MLADQVLVTGGAGFVGSHLVERLLQEQRKVTTLDNGSTGQRRYLKALQARYDGLTIAEGDLLDPHALDILESGFEMVFHLAANADIRHGLEHPGLDFQQNVLATANVLEAMRCHGVKRIMLASTAAVYGKPSREPKPENAPFPVQTSFYAASKVAAEALISAYCEGFDMQAYICRFTPMIGERYAHGHLFDFVKKLRASPQRIVVLGDGSERKYSIYVGDAIDAVLLAVRVAHEHVNIFNIGNTASYTIAESVDWIAEEMGVQPIKDYTGRRWVGDDPYLQLDCARMQALGWQPATEQREAVRRTARYLLDNPWLLDARD